MVQEILGCLVEGDSLSFLFSVFVVGSKSNVNLSVLAQAHSIEVQWFMYNECCHSL